MVGDAVVTERRVAVVVTDTRVVVDSGVPIVAKVGVAITGVAVLVGDAVWVGVGEWVCVGLLVEVDVRDAVTPGVAENVADGTMDGVMVGVSVGLATRPQKLFRLPIMMTEATLINRQRPMRPKPTINGIENRFFSVG